MKSIFFALLCILLSLNSYSQEQFSQTFGKVTQHEMSMSEYEKDNDAEALVIYELGENYFQGEESKGFLLHIKKATKIKILKQAGINYANFEIPYYNGSRGWETISDIEAYTYNYDNGTLTKVKLDPKNIHEEKIDNDLSVNKIALSDVREGSVVEFRYKIVTPYFFNMRKWEFQKKIPVVYSKLVYRAIPYYEYTYIVRGTNKFSESSSKVLRDEIHFGGLTYKEMEYNFGMKDLPAFRDEEFVTSPRDYMVMLDFQLSKVYYTTGGKSDIMTTWPQMIKDFMKEDQFGKYLKDSQKEAQKKILPTLDINGKTQLEQTKIITNYVKSMYNWNGTKDKFTEGKLSDFLKLKTGNSADINLFLTGMLRAANIDANPVMLSTRQHGAISKSHPFQHFFNYVIAEVNIDSIKYLIDGTEPLHAFNELPERCINVNGLVVKEKSENWVVTAQEETSTTEKHFRSKIDLKQNKMEVDAKYTTSGYSAYNYRVAYLNKKENLEKHLKKVNNVEIINETGTSNYENSEEPFIFSFKTDFPIEQTPDKLFISPFYNFALTDNPFKQKTRTLPVDIVYMRKEKYKTEIEIPENYKVEYLPKDLNHDSRMLSIQYSAKEVGNVIEIEASYGLKTNMFDAKDYQRLKASFSEIIKQLSDMIILVKK